MRRFLGFGVGGSRARSRLTTWLVIIGSIVAMLGLGAPPATAYSAPIKVAPGSIDFGTKAVGRTYFDDVKITNTS